MKDWTGNSTATHVTNQRRGDAQQDDYYATDPRAVELLLARETFTDPIWEPACGEGHISKVLLFNGHEVYSSDLIDRGYGHGGVDFLCHQGSAHQLDIITNPPYKHAKQFVEKALDVVATGRKVAMFLKLTFLEGQGRRELFDDHPPTVVYVSCARLECGKNGDFTGNSAVAYCWIVWEKGYHGPTHLKWMN